MDSATTHLIYGLTVRSDIALEMPVTVDAGMPDLTIIRESLPPGLPEVAGLHTLADGDLLSVPGAGRYYCQGGSRITVDAIAGASERNVRLFLLGSAMGLILHQRGRLALHANAIMAQGQALLFLGESGAGKSTLAAWCAQQGYSVLSDDVCAISFNPAGGPIVHAGPPRVRLWRDALERLELTASDFSRSFDDDPDYDKFDVPLNCSAAASEDTLVRAVSVLEEGCGPAVLRLTGVEAVEALYSHTYRGSYLSGRACRKHWESCVLLARNTAIFKVSRPRDLINFDRDARDILSQILSLTA